VVEIAGVGEGVKIFAKGVFELLPAAKQPEQIILS
jgi:hypothetical protein